jgi:hypothetical protein
MAKYIIKNNLPNNLIAPTSAMNRKEAARHFMGLVYHLNINNYNTKMVFRNHKGKDLRGTIQVEIDGFYYYVELYKEL